MRRWPSSVTVCRVVRIFGEVCLVRYIFDCVHVASILFTGDEGIPRKDIHEDVGEDIVLVNDDQYEIGLKRALNTLQLRNGVLLKDYTVFRESCVFLGGGRAALLQLANEQVSNAIAAHSNIYSGGVQRRFHRTFLNVFAMTYGDLKSVALASRRVRKIHNKVNSDLFSASNLKALWWVHATLQSSAIQMYEIIVQRLSNEQKGELIKDGKTFASLFGISESSCPDTWQEFNSRFDSALNSFKVNKNAKDITHFLFTPPKGKGTLIRMSMYWICWITHMLLPTNVQLKFNYFKKPPGAFQSVLLVLNLALVRFVYRLLPPSSRYVTPYLNMKVRAFGTKPNAFQTFFSALSLKAAKIILNAVMPEK